MKSKNESKKKIEVCDALLEKKRLELQQVINKLEGCMVLRSTTREVDMGMGEYLRSAVEGAKNHEAMVACDVQEEYSTADEWVDAGRDCESQQQPGLMTPATKYLHTTADILLTSLEEHKQEVHTLVRSRTPPPPPTPSHPPANPPFYAAVALFVQLAVSIIVYYLLPYL